MSAEYSTPIVEDFEKYGQLTVLSRRVKGNRGAVWCMCRCMCGREKEVRETRLLKGYEKSCGCWQRKWRMTHGHTRKPSRVYTAWSNMHDRCRNPGDERYDRYGGRGIRVCERWQGASGFANFLADMGEPPDGMTLDRKNANGDYEPDNCRWATRKVQQRNRTVNRILTFQGRTQCLAEWADEFSMHQKLLGQRISRGWSAERALTQPVQKKKG